MVPLSIHGWSASSGILAGSKGAEIMEEIADSLRQSGIKVELFHPEAAPGKLILDFPIFLYSESF